MFVARLREEWGWNVCSASCTAGIGYRVAALAGRGGRRGCADEDMAGGVQGAGVSLLNRPCCIGWSIGGRNEGVEAEDAAAPRGYGGISSVAPRSSAASPPLRQQHPLALPVAR